MTMLEINVGGVYLPAPLVWAVAAFALSILIERVLSRTGFYGLVWHRALFELAVFVILWGAISAAAYHMAFSGTSLQH
jgi:hypothetical protein